MNKLNGWKSYAVMGAGIIFNGLVANGMADESMREGVNWILMFLLGGTIRHGITTTVSTATGKTL